MTEAWNGERRVLHSRYADGRVVFKEQRPPHIVGLVSYASGPHSVLRIDRVNHRIYQAPEYDANGLPVRDIDFTVPLRPDGVRRRGHPGPPHQHRWLLNNPLIGPRAGYERDDPEPLT
jgi:hypothetical protein